MLEAFLDSGRDRPPGGPRRPRRGTGRRSRARAPPRRSTRCSRPTSAGASSCRRSTSCAAARSSKGKPTPEQLEELQRVKEELARRRRRSPRPRPSGSGCSRRSPTRPTRVGAGRRLRGGRRRARASATAALAGRASTPSSAASTWSGRRASRARASATSSATRRCSRSRSTASRSTASRAQASRAVLPPVLVREEAMYGTGFFPTERANIYALESDDLYLTGTSEVALARLHMGEILERAATPLRGVLDVLPPRGGRRGQGHARDVPRAPVQQGRDVRVLRARASRTRSTTGCSRSRRSSCRRSACRTASSTSPPATSARPAAKKYDIEAWFPSQERYREITSTSNTTDFQARRLGIRYRVGEKRLETPHTLNGTAVTDRWLLAVLENFGGDVPDVLRGRRSRARERWRGADAAYRGRHASLRPSGCSRRLRRGRLEKARHDRVHARHATATPRSTRSAPTAPGSRT